MGSTRSVLAALLLASRAAFADELPLDREWSRAFGAPDVDRQVNCAVRWRGGVVVGGSFDLAGSVKAKNIAWWNGSAWYDLGGVDGEVKCLAVVRDTLIVGGEFAHAGGVDSPCIARWTGSKWLTMDGGLIGGFGHGVNALATFRDDLVAMGGFYASRFATMNGASRWDGARWRTLGQGFQGGSAMVTSVYHDRLYVSGNFTGVDGAPANGLAAWDGAHWTVIPWTPLHYGNNGIAALGVAHDLLYAGGSFDSAADIPAHRVAAWDGSAWSAVDLPFGLYEVTALASHGGKLVATVYLSGIWEWDGAKWTRQDSNLSDGYATSLLEDDAGSVVTGYVSAYAQGSAELLGSDVLVRAGGDWAPLQSWTDEMHGFPAASDVRAFTRYRDEIVATGTFESVAERSQWIRVDGLARWDGTKWSAFPGWPPGYGGANGVASSGDTLVAVGFFSRSGGPDQVPGYLFDGTQWTQLDTLNGQFFSPTWYHGSLYVGAFASTLAQSVRGGVYRLDGTHWTEIGVISGTGNLPGVFALAVHDDRLVAGGWFDHIGGVAAQSVAAWDGATWSALGGLVAGAYTPAITSLADVNGTLYAGGTLGLPNYEAVARWDGSGWTLIGPPGHAWALASFDGRLHAAVVVNGTGEYSVLSWDGMAWTPVGVLNDIAETLFPDGDELWVGGRFSLVDGVPSSHVALWHTVAPSFSRQFALSPGYPNPFQGSVAFSYSLPSAGEIRLTVSDARGRHVATLDAGPRGPGDHSVQWDGMDAQGRRAPAGVYFVRLTGVAETSRKVVLLP